MTFEGVLKYPFVFLVAFVVTYLLTPLIKKMAIASGVVDAPSEGRINKVSVPRAGGIAVFIGFHVACAAVLFLPWMSWKGTIDVTWWRSFFLASTLILTVGLVDDIFDIRPLLKLAGQFLAAALLFYFDVRVGKILGVELPHVLDFALTIFWFLTIINAFNLIDGLDGLATGLAIVGAVGMTGALIILQKPGDALVLVAFVGACAAFLRFNFNPAQIFLGDSGSMFLGLTLAAVGLSVETKGAAVASIGVPLLAVGVPVFDTMLAVWRRSLRRIFPAVLQKEGAGSGVMHRDLEHLHHRMLGEGNNHGRVALLLYCASSALVAVGLFSMIYSSSAAGIFLVAFVIGAYVIVKHVVHVELWDSGSLIIEGIKRPSNRVLAVLLYPVLDFVGLGVGLFLAMSIARPELALLELKNKWLVSAPLWCGLPFIMLVVARTYVRVWSRARISEFAILAGAATAGILLSWGIADITAGESMRLLAMQAIVYCYFATAVVVGLRVFPRVAQDLMAYIARQQYDESTPRVVIYGAGFRCTLFLRQICFYLTERRDPPKIVGLLDNDRNLRKRYVHGYQVLGGIRELPAILKQHEIDTIIITEQVGSFDKEALLAFAKYHGISVSIWNIELETLIEARQGDSVSPSVVSTTEEAATDDAAEEFQSNPTSALN